ncbi:MAG TPA: hypothetical protein VE619_00835 [Nitrososphaeraceae archaeon]|nr:hypothetical protein [Nitrososphaeraceae archaeon]
MYEERIRPIIENTYGHKLLDLQNLTDSIIKSKIPSLYDMLRLGVKGDKSISEHNWSKRLFANKMLYH